MREKVFLQTSQAKPVKFKTLQLVLLDIHFLHEKKKEKKTDSRNECQENYDEKGSSVPIVTQTNQQRAVYYTERN